MLPPKLFRILPILFLFALACSTDGDTGNPIDSINTSVNKKSVGDSAKDLVVETTYGSLTIELFYVTGFKPTAATVDNFKSFLENRLQKSGGIAIELKELDSPGQEVYSIADVRNLEDSIRTAYNEGDTIKVFGVYLDGEYSENNADGSVLGVAYRNTSFVIFAKTIQDFSGQTLAPSATVLETTVMNHEFGHLLGLVNAGTPMQSFHQDEAHGRHCDNDNCLMYWSAETGEGLLNMLSGGTVPSLDANCLDDLAAY